MPDIKQRPSDGKTESERFIETARELGCNEDDAIFREKSGGRHRQCICTPLTPGLRHHHGAWPSGVRFFEHATCA
jgi:hypothetical protein